MNSTTAASAIVTTVSTIRLPNRSINLPTPSAAETNHDKPAPPKRKRATTAASKRSRARKSDPEPGEEGQEVDWMRGLSTRLSAYTVADENGEPPEVADEDES